MSTTNLSFVPSRTASACALLCLAPVFAQAQASATVPQQALPQVVITAADTAQALGHTIANTTLISDQEIRRSGFVDLPSLLRGTVGVDFTQNGGMGTTSSVFMRGAASTQVLVLIDGLRVGSATTGTASLDQIMLDEVDHIEIVRGNVSALYGSAAVGGVIQIFTRTGKGPARPQVSLEVGSHNTRRASAGVHGAVENTGYALSMSTVRTDGISAQDPATSPRINPDSDGYRNTSATANLTHTINSAQQVGLRAYVSRGLTQVDSAFAPSTSTSLQESRAANSDLSGFWQSKWTADWSSTLRVGSSLDDSEYTVIGSSTTHFNTNTRQADLKNNFRLAPGQLASIGLQSVQQNVDSTTVYDRNSRSIDSLTASYNGDYDAVQVQAALRHDQVVGGVHATTGLLGVAVPVSDTVRLIGNLSTAFNLPTFNQLYYPGFGNPDLQPEKASSWEAGGQIQQDGILARVVWFHTRYRDLIDSPAPTYATVNVNRARSEGVELSASGKIDDWTLRFNATHQDPHDETTGQVLNRRATFFGAVDVARDLGAWQLGGQLASSNARRDGTRTLGGYTLLNLQANWKFQPEWTLRARINNLTDASYQTVYSYNQLGREAFLGLIWQP